MTVTEMVPVCARVCVCVRMNGLCAAVIQAHTKKRYTTAMGIFPNYNLLYYRSDEISTVRNSSTTGTMFQEALCPCGRCVVIADKEFEPWQHFYVQCNNQTAHRRTSHRVYDAHREEQ